MATKYLFPQKTQGIFSLAALRTTFKVLGWLELAFGSLLLLATVHELQLINASPHVPPNDNLMPAILIGIVMPNAIFLLIGGIAVIRKWRHQLLWQLLPMATLMFVIFIAVAGLLRI